MLLTRAGEQAVARGALLTAVELLDRGLELTGDTPDAPPEAVAGLLEELLNTLVLTGDVRRVPELGDRLDRVLTVWGAPSTRRAAGFLTRARAAATAQQWEAGLTAVRQARDLLGDTPDPASRAALDAIAAHLVLNSQRPDRLESARVLAEGAVATAEEVGLPEVACKALNMLGYCLRPRDLGEAEDAFARLVATAEAHALPVWRIRGMLELGVLDRVRFTGTDRLLAARGAAEETGAVLMTAWADMHLTLAHILRDEQDRATRSARRLQATARRLRLREVELIGAACGRHHRRLARGAREAGRHPAHPGARARGPERRGALGLRRHLRVGLGPGHLLPAAGGNRPRAGRVHRGGRRHACTAQHRRCHRFPRPVPPAAHPARRDRLGRTGRPGHRTAFPGPLGPSLRLLVPGRAAGPRGPGGRGHQGGGGSPGRHRRHPLGRPSLSAPGCPGRTRRRLG